MDLTEQEVRSLIRDEIRKLFNIADSKNTDIKYAQTREAAKILGYKNSQSLYKLIRSGVLRVGKEVQDRRSPMALNADYWFNLKACQKRLDTPPEKRAN